MCVCVCVFSQRWPHAIALMCCLPTLKSFVAVKCSISDRRYIKTRVFGCCFYHVVLMLDWLCLKNIHDSVAGLQPPVISYFCFS